MARTNRSVAANTMSKAGSRPQPARKLANVVALPGRGAAAPRLMLDLGRVVAIKDGNITVVVPRLGPEPRQVRSTVAPNDLAGDDQVVVAALGAGTADLVILGRLHDPLAAPRDVRVNGRKVSIEADTELVLKCAAATIRIGRNGLVAVRGDQVVTQARGVNRIRGGSVEIN